MKLHFLTKETEGSVVDSGEDLAERTDAVDRVGITAFRGSMSPQPARQLILSVMRQPNDLTESSFGG